MQPPKYDHSTIHVSSKLDSREGIVWSSEFLDPNRFGRCILSGSALTSFIEHGLLITAVGV